ncbi:restriction endonuclease subunit S [Pseudomonas stutzeri]|uniref:Restriction endonuclease subunit S n=2 Tax=Stutzerimonas stutzeri TaxID=316 RepID=A0AA40RWX1_STUST|nr:restriction endonuclease subunit S [Stutzerimonas stutzeri]MBA1307319.1 restriction endonuclease subunit S [Stutzerimonas stutzeri]
MTNLSGANLNNGAAVGPQGEGMESPSTFPKYPAYKDSGVEWLGEVPQHWVVTKFSRHFSVRMGETIPETELSEEGWLPVYSATERDKFYGYVDERKPLVENGDLVIPARGNSIGFVKLVKTSATATQTTIVANVLDHKITESSYVYYWCLGLRKILFYFDRTAIPQITTEYVCRNPLLLPSLAEQTQIARFLDHETARIDALIEEQQRLIELLKEKRQAVISHAVTKGLDPTVPMKDSGVEWLGEVPAHWDIRKLKSLVSVRGGSTPSKEIEHYWRGDIPWVSPKDMKSERINDSIDHVSDLAIKDGGLNIVESGAVLIVVRGMILIHSVPVAITDVDVTINQDMKAMTPGKKISCDYLLLLLQGVRDAVFQYIDSSAHGTRKLEWERFELFELPIPSHQEQIKIVSFIEKQKRALEDLAEQAASAIDLMTERRSALISAAITGKIDVRGWQPPARAQAPELEEVEAV